MAVKARAHGVPEVRVDGMDALALYGTFREACASTRRGEGPVLVECVNYRLGPHSTSDDPGRYRAETETHEWRRGEPLERLRGYLLRCGGLDAEGVAAIEADAANRIDQALLAVAHLGPPPLESLFEDVYDKAPWPLLEQRAEARRRAKRPATSESG